MALRLPNTLTPASLKRVFFYPLAFLAPPLLLAAVLTLSQSPPEQRPLPELVSAAPDSRPDPGTPPVSKRFRTQVLISNQGTQVSELLNAYEVLGASGLFQLTTVAPERKPSPTTGALWIQPDHSLADAPPAEVLVVPSVVDPENRRLVDWLRERGPKAKLVLCLGAGARLGIAASLFRNRWATTDLSDAPEIERLEPRAKWIRGARYVEDENLISSTGKTGAIDASLHAIQKLAGESVASETARLLGITWLREPDPTFEDPQSQKTIRPVPIPDWKDFFELLLRGGFDWERKSLAVLVFPGVSEISLAASLDTFPRLPGFRLYSLAAERAVVLTRHQLAVIPSWGAAESTPPAELLIVPAGGATVRGAALEPPLDGSGPLQNPAIRNWITLRNGIVKSYLHSAPGSAFDQNLALLAQLDSPYASAFSAKMVAYPLKPIRKGPKLGTGDGPPSDWPAQLWIKPLVLGLLGLLTAWGVDLLLRQKRSRLAS